jgi:hypothetical protein
MFCNIMETPITHISTDYMNEANKSRSILRCRPNWYPDQTSPICYRTVVLWFPKSMSNIVERNIWIMRTPAAYLNITHLSELRTEAHPSVYTVNRERELKPPSTEQRQQPIKYGDCNHWCLPGLPDTWNVLMLASLRIPPSKVHLLG